MTNQRIDVLLGTLGQRHYVLKSAYPRDERRFHVAVQPSRLNEYDLRFPGGFALVLYKPKLPDTYGYVVIPHARVRGMFIEERRDAKDGGWNAYVTVEGRFRTSADRTREIDVTDCRGCWPLPQGAERQLHLRGDDNYISASARLARPLFGATSGG